MKKILFAAVAALVLTACGSNAPKAGSPVDELTNLIDKGIELTSSDPQSEELEALGEQIDNLFEQNKDYVLTDADKEVLIDKLAETAKAAAKAQGAEALAQAEALGVDIDALIKEQLKQVEEKLKECTTLGELTNLF